MSDKRNIERKIFNEKYLLLKLRMSPKVSTFMKLVREGLSVFYNYQNISIVKMWQLVCTVWLFCDSYYTKMTGSRNIYTEPSRTSKTDLFAKIDNGNQPTIITESFILDVWLGPGYASRKRNIQITVVNLRSESGNSSSEDNLQSYIHQEQLKNKRRRAGLTSAFSPGLMENNAIADKKTKENLSDLYEKYCLIAGWNKVKLTVISAFLLRGKSHCLSRQVMKLSLF